MVRNLKGDLLIGTDILRPSPIINHYSPSEEWNYFIKYLSVAHWATYLDITPSPGFDSGTAFVGIGGIKRGLRRGPFTIAGQHPLQFTMPTSSAEDSATSLFHCETGLHTYATQSRSSNNFRAEAGSLPT